MLGIYHLIFSTMKILPNSEVYADSKLQLNFAEFESIENARTFNHKDHEAIPGLPEAEVHFFYYTSLDKQDVKKERSGK